MHLWQIRHFPKNAKSFSILTAALALAVTAAILIGPPQFDRLTQAQDSKAADKKAAPNTDGAERPQDSSTAGETTPADAYVRKALRQLLAYNSVTADIIEHLAFGNRRFRATGSYLQGGEQRLRLEFTVQIGKETQGTLLEVCDGQVLWTRSVIGETPRVTRRDVRTIRNAITANDQLPREIQWRELGIGLGGLPALLSSMERTMVFDALKEETSRQSKHVVVQGRWKSDYLAKLPRASDNTLPEFVPDRVRIYFDATTLFPRRIRYLKKLPEKEAYQPIATLDFNNVVLNGPVDADAFNFVPRDQEVPEDITKQYLEQLKSAAGAETPAAK